MFFMIHVYWLLAQYPSRQTPILPLSLVTNNFWWSTLQADVVQFVTQCATCQMAKVP